MNGLAQIQPSAVDIKSHTAFDLEKTLVAFLDTLFKKSYRLDNPTLNLAQATQPAHPIVADPDTVVPFDYTARAQTLMLKQAPRVVRGRIPRTVTGEINLDKLPDVPNIIVQCISANVMTDVTHATVRMLVTAYDENPDSQGYQDVLNMIEASVIALTSAGQGAIDEAYPIVMPIDWKMIEADTFPHYVGEITSKWELPSARPLPDFGECFIPAEHIELKLESVAPPADELFTPRP